MDRIPDSVRRVGSYWEAVATTGRARPRSDDAVLLAQTCASDNSMDVIDTLARPAGTSALYTPTGLTCACAMRRPRWRHRARVGLTLDGVRTPRPRDKSQSLRCLSDGGGVITPAEPVAGMPMARASAARVRLRDTVGALALATIKRHPLLSFIALAYAFAWWPIALYLADVQPPLTQFATGPLLAALVVTAATGGRQRLGVRARSRAQSDCPRA